MAESMKNKASAPCETGQTTALWRQRKQRRQEGIPHPVRTLVLVAVCSMMIPIILITGFFPLLRVYGGSMSPTLNEGEIVIGVKGTELEYGQLCAFRHGDQILIKRVIAVEGDIVDMDADGTIYVNGELLEEPYVSWKSVGNTDVSFPMTAPEETYFVMGDHRSVSHDSRCSDIGCVQKENMIGRILFRIWPLSQFGVTG